MTKNEFLMILGQGLDRAGTEDKAEILAEYEQHFAFKLADGYSEEEIAAQMGDPAELADQFEAGIRADANGRKAVAAVGLGFADVFAACGFVLLWAWELVMVGLTLACGLLAVCLVGGLRGPGMVIPPVPYWCGAVFGLCFGALAVLTGVGSVYFAGYLRQLFRSWGRFHHNVLAAAGGRPALPPVPAAPQMGARCRRILRQTALVSLTLFAACFILGMVVSMLSAGALEFWHAWGWFGYGG